MYPFPTHLNPGFVYVHAVYEDFCGQVQAMSQLRVGFILKAFRSKPLSEISELEALHEVKSRGQCRQLQSTGVRHHFLHSYQFLSISMMGFMVAKHFLVTELSIKLCL